MEQGVYWTSQSGNRATNIQKLKIIEEEFLDNAKMTQPRTAVCTEISEIMRAVNHWILSFTSTFLRPD